MKHHVQGYKNVKKQIKTKTKQSKRRIISYSMTTKVIVTTKTDKFLQKITKQGLRE